MPSRHVQLADAVAASMTAFAGTLSTPITVERSWRPRQLADELQTIVVSVVPTGIEAEHADRTVWRDQLRIALVVARSVSRSAERAEIDELDALTEAIADRFREEEPMTGFGAPAQIETEAFLDQSALDALAVFRGVVTLTYQAIVEV